MRRSAPTAFSTAGRGRLSSAGACRRARSRGIGRRDGLRGPAWRRSLANEAADEETKRRERSASGFLIGGPQIAPDYRFGRRSIFHAKAPTPYLFDCREGAAG